MTHSKCNFGVKIVNCCCFLDISIYSFLYVAASNQQTPVFKAWYYWFINPLEVMFTSAVGFGEHHFLGIDKSQCPPYEKSLIVYYLILQRVTFWHANLSSADNSSFLMNLDLRYYASIASLNIREYCIVIKRLITLICLQLTHVWQASWIC
jgi:hypothetical protein